MTPTFTVLIGSIGRPSLRRSLESIASQGLVPGDQVIVSMDAYEQTVQDVCDRMKLVRDFGFDTLAFDAGYHWLGVEQINFAMREVPMTGSHVTTIGDDDIFLPGAYDQLRRVLENEPRRPAFWRFVAPNGWLLWDKPRLKSCYISGCCVGAPREFVGQMHTRLETTHDYDWMVDIVARAKAVGQEPLWIDYTAVIARPNGYVQASGPAVVVDSVGDEA